MPLAFVVQDDPDWALLLELNLEAEGFTVETVDPYDALSAIRERRPDVVLLNLDSRRVDPGWWLLEALGELRNTQPDAYVPPVIVLSSYDDPTIANEAAQLGAAAYMLKPFGLSELVGKIRATIKDV